jgi:hypothetical protein
MEDQNSQPLFPANQQPEVDLAYFQKLSDEMKIVGEKMREVAAQPHNEEIWCVVGDIQYGHPITPLLLRYRALIWLFKNPPDPRGEKMYSRPGPYVVYVRRSDFIDILGYSESTIDRMLSAVREAFSIKPYGKITVEQFCFEHTLPEDKIQQQLEELFHKRRNKHKGKGE